MKKLSDEEIEAFSEAYKEGIEALKKAYYKHFKPEEAEG